MIVDSLERTGVVNHIDGRFEFFNSVLRGLAGGFHTPNCRSGLRIENQTIWILEVTENIGSLTSSANSEHLPDEFDDYVELSYVALNILSKSQPSSDEIFKLVADLDIKFVRMSYSLNIFQLFRLERHLDKLDSSLIFNQFSLYDNFDLDNGTDTSGIVELSEMQGNLEAKSKNVRYVATSTVTIDSVLNSLPVGVSNHQFVDIGCGKGRVTMLAADYGFPTVVGVEYDQDLAETARKNWSIFSAKNRLSESALDIRVMDIRDFDPAPRNCVYFLYEPVSNQLFTTFLDKVEVISLGGNIDTWIVIVADRYLPHLREQLWLDEVNQLTPSIGSINRTTIFRSKNLQGLEDVSDYYEGIL